MRKATPEDYAKRPPAEMVLLPRIEEEPAEPAEPEEPAEPAEPAAGTPEKPEPTP